MKLPIISLLFLNLASTTLAIPTLANAKAIFARDQKQRSATRRLGSDNWSGALVHYSDTGRYKSVYAELVIPKIIFPTNGRNKSATYSTSVWVGFGGYNFAIDGYASALDGMLMTGFYYLFDPEGDAGVYAFHEWYPDGVKWFDEDDGLDPKIEMGDRIRMTVNDTSTPLGASGIVMFENLTKNITVSKRVEMPKNGEIDYSMAEWIVESFAPNEPNDVNFGTMHWENMNAIQVDGSADLGNAYFLEAFKNSSTTYTTDVTIQLPDTMIVNWHG